MNYIQRFNKELVQELPSAWERKQSLERAGSLPIPKHKHPTVSLTREQSSLHGLETPARRGNQEGNEELQISRDTEKSSRVAEAGGGVQSDFSALSVRKTLPSRKCGRKLLPCGRRDVGTLTRG